MPSREERIAAEARLAGFTLAGCAPVVPLAVGPFLSRWLAEGRAGEMEWLARRTDERLDPRARFPWARGVISVAYPYLPPPPPPQDWRETLRGRIAAYALGDDYHHHMTARLDTLARRLHTVFPDVRFHAYVDTGPVLEREWAVRAGVGWIAKNTLVLHRAAGSYFFLGELFTDLELDPAPLPVDHCGTCVRCVAACPTGALERGYTMDPRRCISYLTIEHRGAIPTELRPHLANWVFGCDICQEVCPWNGAPPTADTAALAPPLAALLALDRPGFRARYGKTAVARAKRRGLLRNAAVALGNSGNPEAVPALTAALDDGEPLVRAHAAWALGRLGGGVARHALDRARTREPEPAAAAEIEAARAALG
jgi:epoxyqueuosine reductase